MRRTLLVAFALALVAVPIARADLLPRRAAGLRVHEWGVWKLRRAEVAHLADLQRESPAFVRRSQGVSANAGGGAVARKPVIYVYADHPVDVDVEVRFRGGGPWLHYPGAEPLACGTSTPLREVSPLGFRDEPMRRAAPACSPDRLRWRVRAVPQLAVVPMPAAPAGHFWNALRAVPASPLLAPDGSAERFLFYDGPVAFPRAFQVGRGPQGETTWTRVGPAGGSPAIVAWGSRWVALPAVGVGAQVGIDRTQPWPAPPRPLAVELASRLRVAGLTAAEARSLVETWRPEIDAPGLRAFWLLRRSEYDDLLPIQIAPAPAELERVGLVIEDLSW